MKKWYIESMLVERDFATSVLNRDIDNRLLIELVLTDGSSSRVLTSDEFLSDDKLLLETFGVGSQFCRVGTLVDLKLYNRLLGVVHKQGYLKDALQIADFSFDEAEGFVYENKKAISLFSFCKKYMSSIRDDKLVVYSEESDLTYVFEFKQGILTHIVRYMYCDDNNLSMLAVIESTDAQVILSDGKDDLSVLVKELEKFDFVLGYTGSLVYVVDYVDWYIADSIIGQFETTKSGVDASKDRFTFFNEYNNRYVTFIFNDDFKRLYAKVCVKSL